MSLSLLGLIGGLTLLVVLTIRGMNLLIAGPLCAFLVAMLSGLPLLASEAGAPDFFNGYMRGFADFVMAWYMMFLFGSLFGKVMEESGSAESVAQLIVKKMGMKHAALAVVIACAILTYGGVSLFVVAFSVYPMALSLFKEANLPRRFIPAVLAFGSVTFTMTSAGSPEIQNWIPLRYLEESTPWAGWEVSLFVAAFMACFGYFWMRRMFAKAKQNGEQFDVRLTDPESFKDRPLPNPYLAIIPLMVVLGTSVWLHDSLSNWALVIALLGGSLSCWALTHRFMRNLPRAINEGVMGSLLAIGNTAAVVGFGSVAKQTEGFQLALETITQVPGHPLIGAAIAVSVIAGLTGSASGGQSIALPLLAPHYIEQGVDQQELHRVVAISSGALDSLPHNGYVVTTIRAICGEKHADAYGPMAAMTVVTPLIGLVLAITLFIIF